jgi:hypothetical protein
VPSIEDELDRAHALISTDWTGLDLVEADLVPTAHDVGALDGFARRLVDPPLRANLYVFDAWGAGAAVGDELCRLVDGDGYHAVSAVNGALLLFAVSEAPGEAGDAALNRLLDRFHGTF